MASAVKVSELIQLKNILYPTDFSEPSELALPFAIALARRYEATIHALHVLTPIVTPECGLSGIAIDAEVENTSRFMGELDSRLAGVEHRMSIENAITVWEAVDKAIRERSVDLIVIGTHGRTGVPRLLFGSVAEEIFRRSSCPVMTVGPVCRTSVHAAARFRRILFATDYYSPASAAAAPYAASIAEKNDARLMLLHVVENAPPVDGDRKAELSVAEMIHKLYETVPPQVHCSIPPEVVIEYGKPAHTIIEVAHHRSADLIVLGVRSAHGHFGTATHFERTTAHEIVANAPCPVLTIR
jgi:nucleotide-binding universal stress UspA family protein